MSAQVYRQMKGRKSHAKRKPEDDAGSEGHEDHDTAWVPGSSWYLLDSLSNEWLTDKINLAT